jgi:hypothetical protein
MMPPFSLIRGLSIKSGRFHMLDDLSAAKAIHWAVSSLAWCATSEPIRHTAQCHLIEAAGWPVVCDALVGLIDSFSCLQLGHGLTPLTVQPPA